MNNALNLYIERAIATAENAYVPYSKYPVGAVLVGENEDMFTGCNVENASYPASICAERTALVKAVSEGMRRFSCIVVATENGGSPCGICRQMLYEFSPTMRVVCVTFEGDVTLDMTLNELLPTGFGPESLDH
ncbi:MAG: cytidine deaminase [Anaerolineae bacterium]